MTDDDIREIEAEAEREGDLDAIRICQLARDGNPRARNRIALWFKERLAWSTAR